MMENKLPKGWDNSTLKELCTMLYGKGLLTKNLTAEGYPVFGANGIIGKYHSYVYEQPQIIISCRGAASGMVHKTIPKSFVTSNSIVLEIINNIIDIDYFKYSLLSVDRSKIITGSAQPQITIENLNDLEIPIAPLAEQHRMVAKLDALMQKIESKKQRLEKIPKLLKRFRQSVLAAAVNNEGEVVNVKEICENIQIGPFGTQLHKHDYIANGIPLINPTHIQKGGIVPDMDLTISKEKFDSLSNYHLKRGDVIMGRRGEMARCALIDEKENGWICGTGSLFFRADKSKVNPVYLYWILSSLHTKSFLEGEAKGSTMSNLNLGITRSIPIPLPTLEEQNEIVRRVESLFAFADKIEARYTKAKAMLDKLPQTILAKAFRGALVPQNDEDEPASVLLERIKKEKEKANAAKASTTKKKRVTSAKP